MTVYYVTFHGTLETGTIDEQFIWGIAIDRAGDIAEGGEESLAVDCEEALDLFITTTGGQLSSSAKYTQIRVAEVLDLTPEPGTPSLAPAHRRDLVPVRSFNGSAEMLPPQCAVAVSLIAGRYPSGPSKGAVMRGRFYLPGLEVEIGNYTSAGTLSDNVRDKIADGAQAFVQHLDQALENQAVQVWSRSVGVTQTVEEVRVGRIIDTQRRRRGMLKEDYAIRSI